MILTSYYIEAHRHFKRPVLCAVCNKYYDSFVYKVCPASMNLALPPVSGGLHKIKPRRTVMKVDITVCVRCGKSHRGLSFKRLSTTSWYWALCRTTKEPILVTEAKHA